MLFEAPLMSDREYALAELPEEERPLLCDRESSGVGGGAATIREPQDSPVVVLVTLTG